MRPLIYSVCHIGAASVLLQNLSSHFDMSLGSHLHDAISHGNEHEVERLLQNGADVNAVHNRELPFTRAVDLCNNRIAEMLIEHKDFNPNSRNQLDRTPIFYAAKYDKLSMVKKLKSFGCEIDASDIRGVTPLAATGWDDAARSADLLIQNGADVNKTDVKGETPLYRACSNVSTEVVKLLLDHGCSVNTQTKDQQLSPLMASIPSSYELEVRGKPLTKMIDIVKLLLTNNCEVDLCDKNGRTALHHAVDTNEFHSACLFIEHGCSLNIPDNDGLTPFHLAISRDRPRYELALCLLHYGSDPNLRLVDPQTGEKVLPISLVLQTTTNNHQTEKHRQRLIDALVMATDFSNCDFTCLKGDNLTKGNNSSTDNTQNNKLTDVWPFSFQHQCRLTIRRTLASELIIKIDSLPLGWCLKRFLALDFNYKERHPLTTAELHTTVTDNNTSTVETILNSKNIDINSPLRNKSPLTLATERGHIESAILLLQHGADVTELDPNGQNSLHVAASKGKTELLQVLMINQDVNCRNAENKTPLWLAAAEGQFECAILLCLNEADPSLIGDIQIPALHFAAGSGQVKATETFLHHGADVTALDGNGNTALHVAASKGIIYLRNNIRLPAVYKDRCIEMMDAVKMILLDSDPKYTETNPKDYVMIIQNLLDRGCDPRLRNQDGKNAVDISREFGLHEANEILVNWISRHSV